ncbi:hypothetical protein GOBAR_AA24314 [Gossypium barbadense]|uniref:DUF4283 domain-containing protein n=1 Tax=Gossypium barbadense TaxID=3634 RepID=A0A2P5WZ60_GOSBA|nr:hypothetical protein GOBAR_AA24314 [Gossypium barbadense]
MGSSTRLNQPVGMEEDFELPDGDVVTKMVDGIPSITFSDCVYNPRNPVQLLDLENDFSLVRFQDDENVNKVLTGDLWVMWIRLMGMPKGYYSDFLLLKRQKKGKGQNIGAVKGDNHYVKAKASHFLKLNEDMGGVIPRAKGQDKVSKVARGMGNKEPKVTP